MTDKESITEAQIRARNHSPYLAESLSLFPQIADAVLQRSPRDIFKSLVSELPVEVESLEAEMASLRIFKRQAHLVIALADISTIWDWEAVTEHLTILADICMGRLLRAAGAEANVEGTKDNPVPGLFALAVGKYGARELNYSSDIDFNVFYDPNIVKLPNPARAERTLIKIVQSLIKGFERMTGEGYIFRTDLRLRPDPRSNAVAVSTLTAERYYETLGQNWERAAMIKARVCGGDLAVGKAFIKDVLSPFIWRRNLDYAAIDDILAIKRQIHAGKGGMNIHVPGHHLKLGKGGIREIEFYAQVQQLILGGRLPELRLCRTVDVLTALADGNFISYEDAFEMKHHYASLRTLEHRAQMVTDAQTHHVPADEDERESYAKLCGYESRAALEIAVLHILRDVHARYVALFPEFETLSSNEGNLVFTGVEPDPETLATFERLGFERGQDIWREMSAWLGGRIQATKTERAREYLTALAPLLIEKCAETGQPDRAFFAFARFFTNVSTGISLLSMFSREPERLGQLILLMTRSGQVADMLAAKPAILDAMADPDFLNLSEASLSEPYSGVISGANDFEDAINAARRLVREDHFRISTAILLGRISIDDAAPLFTCIADETVRALLPVAIKEVERVAGPVRGNVVVLGLGKMGGREMRLTSDLDIMLIYKPAEGEENVQRLYTKVTQRLVNALSAVTEEGGMFEVDMALRPSGRSGPVAVTIEAFEKYYLEKAWAWEFLALTRARVIASHCKSFESEFGAVLRKAITAKRADLDMGRDIADMLERTKREKLPSDIWDVKNIDGGQRDAEFIVQSLYLDARDTFYQAGDTSSVGMAREALAHGLLNAKQARQLEDAIQFYQRFTQVISLTSGNERPELSALETAAEVLAIGSVSALEKLLKTHASIVFSLVKRFVLNPK